MRRAGAAVGGVALALVAGCVSGPLPDGTDGGFADAARALDARAVADLSADAQPILDATTSLPDVAIAPDLAGPASCGAPSLYAVGTSPSAVIAADWNGDGKLDLAVANTGAGSFSFLLGAGDGSFGASVETACHQSPGALAAGDWNGDGKLDLAVANTFSDDVSVFLGDDAGNFQPVASFATVMAPLALVAADFNGDGRLDLAAAGSTMTASGSTWATATAASVTPRRWSWENAPSV